MEKANDFNLQGEKLGRKYEVGRRDRRKKIRTQGEREE